MTIQFELFRVRFPVLDFLESTCRFKPPLWSAAHLSQISLIYGGRSKLPATRIAFILFSFFFSLFLLSSFFLFLLVGPWHRYSLSSISGPWVMSGAVSRYLRGLPQLSPTPVLVSSYLPFVLVHLTRLPRNHAVDARC